MTQSIKVNISFMDVANSIKNDEYSNLKANNTTITHLSHRHSNRFPEIDPSNNFIAI